MKESMESLLTSGLRLVIVEENLLTVEQILPRIFFLTLGQVSGSKFPLVAVQS